MVPSRPSTSPSCEESSSSYEKRFLAAAATAGLLVAGFPLAQVFFFGKTSYARPADMIVVFGARCYADGRPSQSLEDRVRTACRLYHKGLAPRPSGSTGRRAA